MSKKKLWSLLGFGVVTGVVIFLVVYGNVTHTEPTLAKGCWRGGSVVNLDDAKDNDPNCTDMQPLVWPSLPVMVAFESHNGDEKGARKLLRSAIKDLNGQLGYEHMRLAGEDDPVGDVKVLWGVAFELGVGDSEPGTCSFRRVGDRMHGTIIVREAAVYEVAYRALMHELGHCALTLRHDDYTGSLMYIEAINTRLSDDDREAVRSVYGQ